MLPSIARNTCGLTSRGMLGLVALGLLACALPTLHMRPATAQQETVPATPVDVTEADVTEWSVRFRPDQVVIVSGDDVPAEYVQATISALRQSGHKPFVLRKPGGDAIAGVPVLRIHVADDRARISASPKVRTDDLKHLISHLSKSGVKRFSFDAAQNGDEPDEAAASDAPRSRSPQAPATAEPPANVDSHPSSTGTTSATVRSNTPPPVTNRSQPASEPPVQRATGPVSAQNQEQSRESLKVLSQIAGSGGGATVDLINLINSYTGLSAKPRLPKSVCSAHNDSTSTKQRPPSKWKRRSSRFSPPA